MKKIIYLFIITNVLSGCYRANIADQIDILKVLGFDKKEDNFVGTAIYPEYTMSGEKKNACFLKAEASTANRILSKMNNQTYSPIEIGKLNMLIFGEELAQRGISGLVRTICRDPLVGSNLNLAIAEGSAERLLQGTQKEEALFLSDLLRQNTKEENVPLTNLQVFLFDFYGEGRDAYLPFLKTDRKQSVIVDGIGVFRDDKLKLHLNQQETFIFKLFSSHTMNGNMEFLFKKENRKGYIALTNLYGDTNMSIRSLNSIPQITINITMNGLVKEYPSWLNLKDSKNVKFLSKEIENKLEKEVSMLLEKLQDHEVDPIGIGDFVRGKQRDWKEDEFYEIYPSIKFKVKTKLNLLQAGIGE